MKSLVLTKDALAVRAKELEKAKLILNFGDEIGDWRHSKDAFTYPARDMYMNETVLMKIPRRVNETLEVVDEYDEQTEEKSVALISGLCAGAGKSYIPQ